MSKKMVFIFIALFSVLSIFSTLNAEDLMDVNVYAENDMSVIDSKYMISEHEDITLPFVNSIDNMSVIFDEDVNHSGITIATGSIEILKNLKGLHILYNNDSVVIKGKVDYPIIISQNVIIEGIVTGDVVIYSPNVTIKENAKVLGDMLISSTNLKIEGEVSGNVIASLGGECVVTGTIGKSLRVETSTVDLENSKINGDILIKTNSDTTKVLEKYPEATIEKIAVTTTESNVQSIIFDGVLTVVIFTILGFVIVRKENNIFTKVQEKVKGRLANVILSGTVVLLPSIVLVMLLIIICILGLWIIGVPALVIYVAYVLTTCILSTFIVGTTIFEYAKYKVIKKYEENITIKKLGLLALIYAILFTLANIPFISTYVILALWIFSTGIVSVYIMKEKKKEIK